MTSILIENALLVVSCDDSHTKINNGSIYITDNQITEIQPCAIKRAADDIIDATGKIVLPGFVNTHHHLFQNLTRNVPTLQNVRLFDWLKGLYEIWRELSQEAIYISAKLGIAELFLSGCTTTTDHLYLFPQNRGTHFIDEEVRAAREMGIRFQPTRGSMSRGKTNGGLPPDDIVQEESVILADCKRVVQRYHDPAKFSMCRVSLAPCSPFSVTSELMRETKRLAREYNLRCHTHLAETLEEEEYCQQMYGCRPVEYLESIEWLGPDTWLAHCVFLNDEEIRKFSDTGTSVAHCPTSNMRLGSGIAPVRKLLDQQVAVGIGVDGSASNDTSNMLAEIRQALLVHRLNTPCDKWLTAEEVVWMATRGGARLLGRDDIGSLEVGKAADLILIDMNQINFAGSLGDPLAAIVFAQSHNRVDTAIVNGRILVREGQLLAGVQNLIKQANAISYALIERSRKSNESLVNK